MLAIAAERGSFLCLATWALKNPAYTLSIDLGVLKTNQCTISEQGGTVSDP